MVAIAPCPACREGSHAEHDAAWGRVKQKPNARPEELVIGGYHCACPGDCPDPTGEWSSDWFFKDRRRRAANGDSSDRWEGEGGHL